MTVYQVTPDNVTGTNLIEINMSELTAISEPDITDKIAKEIGKSVVSHIQCMYPEASSAVAWGSCSLSIEGVVRNAIASAGKAAENGGIDEWLKSNRRDRLAQNRAYRK